MAAGQQHRERRADMKAANITGEVLNVVKWDQVRNRNGRPTRSLVLELRSFDFQFRCNET
jgi:hypothetical protein